MATLDCSTLTHLGQDGISRSAVICGPYRYELRLTWSNGPRMVAVGLNPPGGHDFKPSPTVTLLANYARRHRFGGLVLLNLFAWKATKPAHLMAALQRGEDVIGTGNDFVSLRMRIEMHSHQFDNTVVAYWGSHGLRRGNDFLGFLGRDYVLAYVKCFGLNSNGSPLHPLHKTQTLLQEYIQ